jgi:hypothetical protein
MTRRQLLHLSSGYREALRPVIRTDRMEVGT